MNGGDDNDTLVGGTGSDTLNGGNGEDILIVYNTQVGALETLNSGADNDRFEITTSAGLLAVDGGTGYDVLEFAPVANTNYAGTTFTNLEEIHFARTQTIYIDAGVLEDVQLLSGS